MFNAFQKKLIYRQTKPTVDAKGRKINATDSDIPFTGFLFIADHKTVEDIRYRDVTHICITPCTYSDRLFIDDFVLDNYIIDGSTKYIIIDYGTGILDKRQVLYLKRIRENES